MRLTQKVHQHLETIVEAGETCIDATAGNGHDTLLMAQLVGPNGRVIAIDIQAQAIDATERRLAKANQLAVCELILGDHSEELERLQATIEGTVRALTFNLGYLPGGDKHLISIPEKTIQALEASTRLLCSGGTLFVTAYRGHPGGELEAKQVEQWMDRFQRAGWDIETHKPATQEIKSMPPILWIAKKPEADRTGLSSFTKNRSSLN